MARLRPYALAALAVALTHSTAWSDSPRAPRSTVHEPEIVRTAADAPISRFYSLADLAEDAKFAQWIIDTMQAVVAEKGGRNKDGCAISYYAPKKLLMVCHSPAVHHEVTKFLSDLRSSLAAAKDPAQARKHALMPAQYQEPSLVKTGDATQPNNYGYPVPAQVKQPKHLFHFIIRYEGEGIIDSNVAELFKNVYGAATKESEAKDVIVPGTVLTPGGNKLNWVESGSQPIRGPYGFPAGVPLSPNAKPVTNSGKDESDPESPKKTDKDKPDSGYNDSKLDDSSKGPADLPRLPSTRESKLRDAGTTPPYILPPPIGYPRTLRRS